MSLRENFIGMIEARATSRVPNTTIFVLPFVLILEVKIDLTANTSSLALTTFLVYPWRTHSAQKYTSTDTIVFVGVRES